MRYLYYFCYRQNEKDMKSQLAEATTTGLHQHLEDLAMHLKSQGYRVFMVKPDRFASTYFWFTNGARIIYVQDGNFHGTYQFSAEYVPVPNHGSGVVLLQNADFDDWKEAIGIRTLRRDPKRASIPEGAKVWNLDKFIQKKKSWWKDRFQEI